MGFLTSVADWIVGTLWPSRCAACGLIGDIACRPCLKRMVPPDSQRCPGCQRQAPVGLPCPACRSRTHLDRLIYSTALTGTAELFIYALKYRGIESLACSLADRMTDLSGSWPEIVSVFANNPLIVPVPLHAKRTRERGYNQAHLLAARIAAITAMPFNSDALVRTRSTGQQTKTSTRAERLDNMRGAFTVEHPDAVAGRDIVLIDDVTTTGATLQDCARALKESGARYVYALVCAHG